MPIQIELRQNSQVISLSAPGKSPILSRRSSFNFYNPLELLCAAVGACFGQELWYLCYYDNINPEIFESLMISMDNFEITITLQCPSDILPEFKKKIEELPNKCIVSKQLNNNIKLILSENQTPVEVLTDQSRKGYCCGRTKPKEQPT